MIAITSQQGSVLTLLCLAILGFVSAFCLWCGKRSKIVQEDNQIYNQEILQRDGSKFAVTRTKTVTRPNQKSPEQPLCNKTGQFAHASKVHLDAVEDTQGSYQNVPSPKNCNTEQIYVDPIPTPPFRTPPDELMDNDTDTYINILPTQDIDHDSDSNDYENAQFLHNADEDEPDYVNAKED
ncbi:linker for activation of T-cells family member 2 [Electrophorus electricus]|uniref:linker for activation of T-cells family member 2 n=1 Tax=Electrophorus electricus TaxID=8005 RepID=UPI000F09C52D|nr:linker for activation of T-cells family member 2 [Electrophorus electricus]